MRRYQQLRKGAMGGGGMDVVVFRMEICLPLEVADCPSLDNFNKSLDSHLSRMVKGLMLKQGL